MTIRSITFALLALVLLSSACTPIHKVARLLKPCWPNQELAAEYACRTYGFCGANAGLIIVGDTWTFTSDWQDNKARWITVESLPHEIMDCK